MSLRFAFMGFRHGHIQDLYARAREMEGVDVVAACEEHGPTREGMRAKGAVEITHSDYGEMLARVPCDVIAIGDTFARRGGAAVRALSEGKHVIADKPLCTRLEELDEIERLSGAHGLKVGCMLTMRDSAVMQGLRERVQAGCIGEVHGIAFGGEAAWSGPAGDDADFDARFSWAVTRDRSGLLGKICRTLGRTNEAFGELRGDGISILYR